MNRQFFIALAISASFSLHSSAQNAPTERTAPAAEMLKIREGETADFQKLMRRLETAIKENDISSAQRLQSEVVLAMKKRVADLQAEPATEPKQLDDLKQQQAILQSVEKTTLSDKREEQAVALDMLRQLHRFEQLMQENFVTN